MRSTTLIKKLGRVSPALLWHTAKRPEMLRVRLHPRPRLSAQEAVVALFPDAEPAQVEAFAQQLNESHEFFDAYSRRFVSERRWRPVWEPWDDFLYLAVRVARPTLVVETGVFDGKSSAMMLLGMHHNEHGLLISIDLPASEEIKQSTDQMPDTTLPAGLDPGWVIPDDLRDRHRLLLGDSKRLLPEVCSESGPIDIFLHDSLHTYEHMHFEYSTVWPALAPGGLLLSDDVFWNAAFYDFCRLHQLSYVTIPDQLGAVRAPRSKPTPERPVAANAHSSSVHAQIPSPTPPEERHG